MAGGERVSEIPALAQPIRTVCLKTGKGSL